MHEHEPFDHATRAYRELENDPQRRRGHRLAQVRLMRSLERTGFTVCLVAVAILVALVSVVVLRQSAGPEAPLRVLPPGLGP